MTLLIHISIALLSVIAATGALVRPTKQRLQTSAVMVALTLASGTYLVWSTHSPILQSCISGLLYTSIITTMLAVAQRRLSDTI